MSDSPPTPLTPSIWPRLGKALAFVLVPVLVATAGWHGFHFAKLHLAIAHAQRELANRQFLRAEFWTNRALGVDARNIEAARLMAEINEAQDKPQALRWRIQVAQLAPGSTGDIMAWAKSAFRFGQREMAINALKGLPPDFQKRSAEYHEMLAGCALAGQEIGLAEEHFARAAELDHGNPVHRVNLAAFRLTYSLSLETRAAATRDLDDALRDPRARLFAARALLTNAIRWRDRATAQKLAETLYASAERTFNDDLTCLTVVMGEPAFHPALEQIEQQAAADVPKGIEAGNWLNSHGLAAETLRWFAQLPESVQADVRLQIAAAEAYLAMSDWGGLETFLARRHWDDAEFLRRAMLIRCQRELSQPWEKEWNQLVSEVEAKPPDGFLLAQLAIGWKWRPESLHLLWRAASRPETNFIALQNLWDLYAQTNETRELLRVVRAQSELDPSNPTKKNNEAFLSLLLYGPSERSERLAREASATNPKVPEWAATYAFALHLAGKEAEAKAVMERLSSDALGRPGIALYYAIVLAANGDHAQAKECLAKLNPHGMLPEERKLAADLAQQLNVASR